MKTTISLPDGLFHLADAAARHLQISRSELSAKATAEFLKRHHGTAITERMNGVYSLHPAKVDPRFASRPTEVSRQGGLAAVGEIQRGEIWWADLPESRGSEPGYRRPVLIVQADLFNLSRLQTAIVAAITGNVELADAPGNILLPARSAGLRRDSVVNVSQLLTLGRSFLTEFAGTLRFAVVKAHGGVASTEQ